MSRSSSPVPKPKSSVTRSGSRRLRASCDSELTHGGRRCIQSRFPGRAPLVVAPVAASLMLLPRHGVRPGGQSQSSRERRGERSCFMPEEFELDRDELAHQLDEHQRLTGTSPRGEESNGMSRRDLLVRGGAAAAAVSGAGALAGMAKAAPAKSGKYTGTLRVITLGVEWPTPE